MRIANACACLTWAMFAAISGAADEVATVVADEIVYSAAEKKFVARGNVVATWQNEQFKANEISYDGELLKARGPLEFSDEQGSSIIAEYGEISADFRDALLEGVELLLEGRIQIDAEQLVRSDGRYLRLDGAMATACRICREGSRPLWHFRARSIVHDAENDRIYLRNSRFYIGNTPIFYFPWMRIPAPSVERASGFLFPTLEFSNEIGVGLAVPYYLTLGDHADMTFTPELTTRSYQALAVEYRRRFRTGQTELDASIALNDPDLPFRRWHINSTSEFSLDNEFKIKATGERVSDPDYLEDYDISSKSKIENEIRVERRQPRSSFEATVTEFEFLDESPPSSGSPLLVQDLRWKKDFGTGAYGWRTALEAGVASYRNFQVKGGDDNEVVRTFARLRTSRDWAFSSGVRASVSGEVLAKAYSFAALPDADIGYANPSLSGELRWPWIHGSDRKREVFEPIIAVAWSPRKQVRNSNLDSTLVEFDDTSFHVPSRFPGIDAVEQGLRVNYGLRYASRNPGKLNSDVFVGRTYQREPTAQFRAGSGLDSMHSNWTAAFDFEVSEKFSFRQKILADNDLSPVRTDAILGLALNDYGVSIRRSWERSGFAENFGEATNHWLVKTEYPLAGNWSGSVGVKYDVNKFSDRRLDFNFNYAHQCLDIRLFLSHQLPSAGLDRTKTGFGLSVKLAGFGEGTAGSSESCG